MQTIPDLTPYGYKIIKELGRNREGGRITWQGKKLEGDRLLVIKQFCFATSDSTWSGYKTYQKELNLLQNLNHPGIPNYLDSIETDNGFCLIQEYIDAIPLANLENITLEQIKIITIRILEILVYLQEREDYILHRDLKPENILIDQEFKPYLIDFGLATIGEKETSASSIIRGTPGFMAPEQAIAPVKASDLYSLGITIICLLTNKTSSEILSLANTENPYQIEFKPLLKQLDKDFLNWLTKMTNPQVKKRFSDAAIALEKLKELTWDWQNIKVNGNNQTAAITELTSSEITTTKSWVNRIINLLSKIPLSPFSLGTLGLGILGTTITIGVDICDRVTDKNPLNLIIAAVGIVIIYITQSAALVSFKTESSGNKEAIISAIAFPIILVAIAQIFLGWGEAIAMTVSVMVAQALNLGYILLQSISFQFKKNKLHTFSLFIAVFLGLLFGNIITP